MAEGLLGFLSGLQNGMQSPLFQSGAAMYNAGAQGQNFGGGFLAGGEAANTASKNIYQQSQQQRQQAQQQQRDQMWQGIMSGKPPPWAANLPRGTLDLARALGPDAGTELIAGMMKSSIGQGHQAAQLAEQRRMHDASIANMEAQRRLQEEDVKRRSATADFELGIMRQLMPGAGGGAVAPQVDPNIRPQSFDGGASGVPGIVTNSDPNFIRTQAVAGSDAPTQASPPDGMVQTPYGPKTPDEARRLAGAMMLSPKFAQAGKAILESIPQTKLGKEVGNELDKKQLNTQESLARLNTIASTFKPEFQTIEDRLGYAWTEFATKFRAGQAAVTPDQERSLAEFSAFRSDAINNLNQYIKEITGAAMTNAEAGRIMRAMPNPGEGIFDGDSPVAFKSKLDVAVYNSKLAIARYNYMRAKGFTGNADEASRKMTLESVPEVMNRRGKELRDQVQKSNPGVRPENLRPLVEQQLRKEFGINI